MNVNFYSSDGVVSVVVVKSEEKPLAWLSLQTGAAPHINEMTIFRTGPLALEQILDLGYEIVNACRKLMPTSIEDLMAAPEMQAEAEAHVPFAINDAIEHDQQDIDFPMSPEQERTLNEVLIPEWDRLCGVRPKSRRPGKP